jgi:hypothetical protein
MGEGEVKRALDRLSESRFAAMSLLAIVFVAAYFVILISVRWGLGYQLDGATLLLDLAPEVLGIGITIGLVSLVLELYEKRRWSEVERRMDIRMRRFVISSLHRCNRSIRAPIREAISVEEIGDTSLGRVEFNLNLAFELMDEDLYVRMAMMTRRILFQAPDGLVAIAHDADALWKDFGAHLEPGQQRLLLDIADTANDMVSMLWTLLEMVREQGAADEDTPIDPSLVGVMLKPMKLLLRHLQELSASVSDAKR